MPASSSRAISSSSAGPDPIEFLLLAAVIGLYWLLLFLNFVDPWLVEKTARPQPTERNAPMETWNREN